MISFCTLFSSSKGNCAYVSDGSTSLLIDAGVSAARITNALKKLDVSPEKINALLVTHEHGDHVCGIDVLRKKHNIPLVGSAKTIEYISGGIYRNNAVTIEPGESIDVGTAKVKAFKTPHDSTYSVGYTVSFGDTKIGFATDIGCVTKEMLSALAGCKAVVVEANHDVERLKNGSYPYPLKQRILSDNGHLSNDNCAWLATQLALWGTKYITLGHLSDSNNTEELAYGTVKDKLEENGFVVDKDIFLTVAEKTEITKIL